MLTIHTVAKILRVLKLHQMSFLSCASFTVAKILRVLKQIVAISRTNIGFTVAKILRVLKHVTDTLAPTWVLLDRLQLIRQFF